MSMLNHLYKKYPEVSFSPEVIQHIDARRGLWHETDADRAAAQVWEAEKAVRLRWVRRAMEVHLTQRERYLVELHYFEGHSIGETARRARIRRETVSRALRRAVEKLRRAAAET